MLLRVFPVMFALIFSSSCIISSDSPIETTSDDVNVLQRGDIVVVNVGNDTILLLDEDGNYKAAIVDAQTDPAISYPALVYDSTLGKLLFAYDHTTATLDSVKSIDLFKGDTEIYITNAQLTGTGLNGIARNVAGDILVLEGTTTAERFNSSLVRQGNPFTAALSANVNDIAPLQNGGFVVGSSNTAQAVRTYSSTAVLGVTATSLAPVPSLVTAMAASGVIQDSTGRICAAYNGGTTDAVRCYNSTLTTTQWTFQDQNVLQTPGKITLRANGNILVTDTTFDHIVEIDPNGVFVRVIGGTVLSDPGSITVIR